LPKSQAKGETKRERGEREARERLEQPDMDLFYQEANRGAEAKD
jgi:hypothetical protein